MKTKKTLSISLFILLFCLFLSPMSKAVVSPITTPEVVLKTDKNLKELSADDILHLERAEVEEKLGRKLKWKERQVLKLTQRRLKKLNKKASKQNLEEAKMNGLAIAGFVCSIVGLLFSLWFVLAILGIIFSAIALKKIKKTGQGGRGLAVAGLVIGIVSFLIGASIWAFTFWFFF